MANTTDQTASNDSEKPPRKAKRFNVTYVEMSAEALESWLRGKVKNDKHISPRVNEVRFNLYTTTDPGVMAYCPAYVSDGADHLIKHFHLDFYKTVSITVRRKLELV